MAQEINLGSTGSAAGQDEVRQRIATGEATSAPNEVYDLVSVLYHSLKNAAQCERYCQDASSDPEIESFFRDLQEKEKNLAQRAQNLLLSRLGQGGLVGSSESLGGGQLSSSQLSGAQRQTPQ